VGYDWIVALSQYLTAQLMCFEWHVGGCQRVQVCAKSSFSASDSLHSLLLALNATSVATSGMLHRHHYFRIGICGH
jgi:hypothetical protein